jgi:hypothetical protein
MKLDPIITLCLVAILACTSAGGGVRLSDRALEIDAEYEKFEVLAEAQDALDEYDRDLRSRSGDFENFEEITQLGMTGEARIRGKLPLWVRGGEQRPGSSAAIRKQDAGIAPTVGTRFAPRLLVNIPEKRVGGR